MNSAESIPSVISFHPSTGRRATLTALFILILALVLFVCAAAIAMIPEAPVPGIVLGLLALLMVPLALLIFVEMTAAFSLRIDVGADAVDLKLPARRGHVRQGRVERNVPFANIAGIETRAEAFSQIGAVAVQQSYRIILRNGDTIDLGADRQFQETIFGDAAQLIAERMNLAIRDRGMVDGAPGLLAAVGTSVPAWSAPPLPDETAGARRTAAANAIKILNVSLLLVLVARLIARR